MKGYNNYYSMQQDAERRVYEMQKRAESAIYGQQDIDLGQQLGNCCFNENINNPEQTKQPEECVRCKTQSCFDVDALLKNLPDNTLLIVLLLVLLKEKCDISLIIVIAYLLM